MAQARLRILSILVAAMVLTPVPCCYTGNTQPGTGEAVCLLPIIDERTEDADDHLLRPGDGGRELITEDNNAM